MSTDKYSPHQILIKKFKVDIIKKIPKIRVFDQHVGLFYRKNGSPIKIGINGQSDCYGLLPTKHGLIYICFEFKTGNAKQSKDQKIWENFIIKNNGIYMVIREDYHNSIQELKNRLESVIN